MAKMERYCVRLEVVINCDKTNPGDWTWLLSNVESGLVITDDDAASESVALTEAELVEEWEADEGEYDTGDIDDFAPGDWVVVTSSWKNCDDAGHTAPVYCDDIISYAIVHKIPGNIVRIDDSDNTIRVHFDYDGPNDTRRTFDYWVIPRVLELVKEPTSQAAEKEQDAWPSVG